MSPQILDNKDTRDPRPETRDPRPETYFSIRHLSRGFRFCQGATQGATAQPMATAQGSGRTWRTSSAWLGHEQHNWRLDPSAPPPPRGMPWLPCAPLIHNSGRSRLIGSPTGLGEQIQPLPRGARHLVRSREQCRGQGVVGGDLPLLRCQHRSAGPQDGLRGCGVGAKVGNDHLDAHTVVAFMPAVVIRHHGQAAIGDSASRASLASVRLVMPITSPCQRR